MPLSVEALDPAALEAGVDVPTYYPGTTNVSLAGLVDVRGGVTAYGIDLSAARSSAFRVSGLITLDPAISATSLSVRLQPQVPGAPAPPMVPTGPGPFTLTGVAPGAYALLVQTTDAGAPVTKTLPVEVIDQDVKGLEIVLRQGVPVRGRLKIDGEADSEPGPAALVQLLVVGQGGPGYSAVRVAADGSYTVPNVRPGDYRFRVIRGGQAFWIKSARFGGQDLRSGLLSVDADFPERELDIVISTRTATLDARVIDEARQPVSGAMVILVPDASRRNLSELFVSGTADGEGRVHLSGLTPGDYRVFASIAIEAAGWQDPNVLRPRETRGAALRLMEGETKPLTLGLTP
jgi:hypothetical protein